MTNLSHFPVYSRCTKPPSLSLSAPCRVRAVWLGSRSPRPPRPLVQCSARTQLRGRTQGGGQLTPDWSAAQALPPLPSNPDRVGFPGIPRRASSRSTVQYWVRIPLSPSTPLYNKDPSNPPRVAGCSGSAAFAMGSLPGPVTVSLMYYPYDLPLSHYPLDTCRRVSGRASSLRDHI